MNVEDAIQYGHAIRAVMQVLKTDGKIEDRKMKELLSLRFGPRRGRVFFERMVARGVFEPDPVGTRLYFWPHGTRDRKAWRR